MENQLPEQRQYSLEEVLSITFNIIKKHWLKFVLIGLIVYVPILIATSFIDTSNLKNIFPRNFPPALAPLKEYWISMLPTFYFTYCLSLIGFFVNFVVAKIVESCANGVEPSLQSAVSVSFKQFLKGFITTILSSIFIFFLSIPMGIPAIIFMVYWWYFLNAIILRNRWGIDALRYSFYVVKGRWWRVVGFSIVFWLITVVASWLPSGIGLFFAKVQFVQNVILVITYIIHIFTMIAGTVLFLNLESTSKFLVRKPIGEEIPTLPEM